MYHSTAMGRSSPVRQAILTTAARLLGLWSARYNRRFQTVIWAATAGLSFVTLRQAAWACSPTCPSYLYPPYCPTGGWHATDQTYPGCCTWTDGGGIGCCQYTVTRLICDAWPSTGSKAGTGSSYVDLECDVSQCSP
jgi:hypothetical protein